MPVTNSKILIVEDDLTQRKLLEFICEKLEMTYVSVSSGQSALQYLEEDSAQFRLILMDWQMPAMDGLACTRAIREKEEGDSRIPIIAVTANAMVGDKEKCLNAGMDDYLSKPFTIDQFREKINKWFV